MQIRKMQQNLFEMSVVMGQGIKGCRGIFKIINRADHPLRLNTAVCGDQIDQMFKIPGIGVAAAIHIQFLL